MNIREIYEAAFDRYVDLIEQAHEITYMDRRCITEQHELEIQSAQITAELVGRAAGPACVAADVPF
jgi:hypothetical protein